MSIGTYMPTPYRRNPEEKKGRTMKTTNTNYRNGTKVINTKDGESGTIIGVCTYRRNGNVYTYVVKTSQGREIWHTGDTLAI